MGTNTPFGLMRLDLTGSVRLQRENAILLDQIATKLRKPFVELVQALGAEYGADLDWWVTSLASRNTYACSLFERLCLIVLAKRIVETGSVSEVIVSTPAMADLLVAYLPRNIRVTSSRSSMRWRIRTAFLLTRRVAAALYSLFARYLFGRLILPRRTIPTQPIVLVDTFVYPESVQADRLHDRHYPGMLDCLDGSERAQVYLSPVYYRVRNFARLFGQLRACRENMLLPENFLRLGDYLYVLGHFFRAARRLPDHAFLGMQVGALTREAYVESYGGSGSLEGILRYRFADRLAQHGVRLLRVIEWFENQELDHGAVAGWLKFHPATPVTGYQGFLASPNYLCMFPLKIEQDCHLLPQKLAVLGPALLAPAQEFCAGLDVVTAPAFRFTGLWSRTEKRSQSNEFTILACLPIMSADAVELVAMLKAAIAAAPTGSQWRIWVKPHPASSVSALQHSLRGEEFAGWQMVNGDLDALLQQADALVSTASSACVQGIVHGVPVAVISVAARPTQNPIPEWVDRSIWAICPSPQDLESTLTRYSQRSPDSAASHVSLGASVREQLFQPVTRASVLKFLGFNESRANLT